MTEKSGYTKIHHAKGAGLGGYRRFNSTISSSPVPSRQLSVRIASYLLEKTTSGDGSSCSSVLKSHGSNSLFGRLRDKNLALEREIKDPTQELATNSIHSFFLSLFFSLLLLFHHNKS